MPYKDDVQPQEEFLTNLLEVGKEYDAIIVGVEKDESKNRYYVSFWLPEFKRIYKEKGRGCMIILDGKGARLGVQFLYNVSFPGKIITPERVSNVSGTPAKEFFVEDQNNWLGIACSIVFAEEPAYNKETGKPDPSRMYKNIKRSWKIEEDGIKGNLNVQKWTLEQVAKLHESLKPAEVSEDDLPF